MVMTLEYAKMRIRYDSENGVFYWRKCEDMYPAWNSRHAGKVAEGHITVHGYRHIRIMGKAYSAHRLAWFLFHGKWPEKNIDHINGDRLDNRISNLRDVSHIENLRNMKRFSRNKSGVNGVVWNKKDKRFHARIGVEGKLLHLGCFKTIEEAKNAREEANRRFGFSKRHGLPSEERTPK